MGEKKKQIKILNVEDEIADHMALIRMIKEKSLSCDVDQAATLNEAYELIRKNRYDVILIDYKMPDGTGLDLLANIKDTPSIFVTGSGDEKVAVDVMKSGAYDYVIKDPAGGYLECLPYTIDRILHIFHMEKEREQIEVKLRESEERFRSITNDILDSSKVGILTLDKDFRVMWVNKVLESYFDLRRDEVINKDERQLIKDKIHHVFENGEEFKKTVFRSYDDNTYVENFVCHLLPGNGREERWLEHWSQPITSGLFAGGRVELYTDITKRKRAEDKIREYSEKLEEMVKGRTRELEEKNKELEHFNEMFVSREFRIKELKERIKELEGKEKGSGLDI